MKSKIFAAASVVAFFCFLPQAFFAQKMKAEKVPSAVKTAFSKQFPTARKVEWEMESATEIEAEFRLGKTETSAKFDPSGKLLETETAIKKSDLPKAVSDAVAAQFAGFEVEEVEKIVFADGSVAFEMEVEKGKTEFEVQFDSAGKLLKKETED